MTDFPPCHIIIIIIGLEQFFLFKINVFYCWIFFLRGLLWGFILIDFNSAEMNDEYMRLIYCQLNTFGKKDCGYYSYTLTIIIHSAHPLICMCVGGRGLSSAFHLPRGRVSAGGDGGAGSGGPQSCVSGTVSLVPEFSPSPHEQRE